MKNFGRAARGMALIVIFLIPQREPCHLLISVLTHTYTWY